MPIGPIGKPVLSISRQVACQVRSASPTPGRLSSGKGHPAGLSGYAKLAGCRFRCIADPCRVYLWPVGGRRSMQADRTLAEHVHIANVLRPRSIFYQRAHLPRLFRCLMGQAEAATIRSAQSVARSSSPSFSGPSESSTKNPSGGTASSPCFFSSLLAMGLAA